GDRERRVVMAYAERHGARVDVEDVPGGIGVVLIEGTGVVVGKAPELAVRANRLILAVRDQAAPLAIPERAQPAERHAVGLVPVEDRRLHSSLADPMPRAVPVHRLGLLYP